jgi:hypothetical protein
MQAFDKINNRYGRGTLKLACGLAEKKPLNGGAGDEAGLSFSPVYY